MRNVPILTVLLVNTIGWAGERKLTVCLPFYPAVNSSIQGLAKGYATHIYRSIGIELRWKSICSEAELNAPGSQFAPNLAIIGIGWASKAPGTIPTNARASARPFEPTGQRITLFLDRLSPTFDDRYLASAILGHVLAHEIGHVLLGHNGHSADGLMKAGWTADEQVGLLHRPMRFSEDQAERLRQVLDHRSTMLASSARRR